MKIEKLNENKIRITLNIKDLEDKNISFHEFMSNPIDSQSLFLDMLDQAEKEVGFKTKDCKIMIEALATSSGDFILTVTKVLPEENIIPKKKIKVKKKNDLINFKNIAIFEFSSFDCFYDFCVSLNSTIIKNFHKNIGISKLYSYNSKYYLLLDKLSNDATFIMPFLSHVLEFGILKSNKDTYKNKLIEYGKCIISKDAILSCHNKFKTKK